jgi:hypothetical protein
LVAALLLTLPAATASAEEKSKKSGWGLELDAGAIKQLETSLDSGGDFDIDRYLVRLAVTRKLDERWSAGVALSYGEDQYQFSGNTGFGGLNPWGTIREARIAFPLRYRRSDTWTFYGIPSLRYRAETGAKVSDSDKWGLLLGAAYRFNERLKIGPGVGVFSNIDDNIDVTPILVIDWKITDTLSLTTGRGIGATRGPGLSLKWTPLERWSFRLSGRREKTSFRLDDNGAVPSGIGTDKSIPLAISASYKPTKAIELHLFGGADFDGNLQLENSDGKQLADSDYDTAPFVGMLITVKP